MARGGFRGLGWRACILSPAIFDNAFDVYNFCKSSSLFDSNKPYARGRQPLARMPIVARRKVLHSTRSGSMREQVLSSQDLANLLLNLWATFSVVGSKVTQLLRYFLVDRISTDSNGHDKPFWTNAMTIIDNFKKPWAIPIIDKSQFFKAIPVIDELLPINVAVYFHCEWRSFFL